MFTLVETTTRFGPSKSAIYTISSPIKSVSFWFSRQSLRIVADYDNDVEVHDYPQLQLVTEMVQDYISILNHR